MFGVVVVVVVVVVCFSEFTFVGVSVGDCEGIVVVFVVFVVVVVGCSYIIASLGCLLTTSTLNSSSFIWLVP